MTTVIDRRQQSKGDLPSRKRLHERAAKHIRKAITDSIVNGDIKDIGTGGIDVTVPEEDMAEPTIHHGKGGIYRHAVPGNREYSVGDKIPKPPGGGQGDGKGDKAGDRKGENTKSKFRISEKEFFDYLFDGLELPNLTKRTESVMNNEAYVHAGIVSQGPSSKLDLTRSKKQKMKRVSAITKPHVDELLGVLEEERGILECYAPPAEKASAKVAFLREVSRSRRLKNLEKEVLGLKALFNDKASPGDTARIQALDSNASTLREKIRRLSKWSETTDLRFHFHEPKPIPKSKAVMFCVMDTSGSMDNTKKEYAKIFYMLLYRFLQRQYDKIDVVFISHSTEADEVNQQDFFEKGESGGTFLSSGIRKMLEIIEERYPSDQWNIYGAQASDGDNFDSDNAPTLVALNEVLPLVQGYFYTEIKPTGSVYYEQSSINLFKKAQEVFKDRLWTGVIKRRDDIWPMFKEFFKSKGGLEAKARGGRMAAALSSLSEPELNPVPVTAAPAP